MLASIGTTQATFDPADLDVAMNGVWVCKASTPHADPSDVDLTAREVTVTIDLKSGTERATVWTNDLTHAYVHENSAYSLMSDARPSASRPTSSPPRCRGSRPTTARSSW